MSDTAPTAGRQRVTRSRRSAAWSAGLGVAVLAVLVSLPYVVYANVTGVLVNLFILLSLATMWNLLAGYAGLISVGQQAYIGVGAYAVFVLAENGLSPFLAIPLAALISALVALPASFLLLRLRREYFAIATWVVAETFQLLVMRSDSLGGGTGASLRGLTGLDPALRQAFTYWSALAVAVATLLGAYLLLRSRLGLDLTAIRDNEVGARSVGVRVARAKRIVYLVAAGGAGAAGSVLIISQLFVQPTSVFTVQWSAYMIFVALIGGLGSIEGPIIGTVIFFLLQQTLADRGAWYLIILGAVGVLMAMWVPRGVWGLVSDRFDIRLFPVGYWLHGINSANTQPDAPAAMTQVIGQVQDKELKGAMSTTKSDAKAYQQFIAGGWADAADGRTFDDLDPFTGEVVGMVPAASRVDAKRAVEAAAAAFKGWSQSPPSSRQRVFLKAADILESRSQEVVSLLARETGCTFGFGMFQMGFVPGLLRQAASLAYEPIGEVIPSDTGAFALALRRPVGVVGAIAPWNAALILSARSIAAALALGNAVVLKPSEWSPVSGGTIWGEIFTEAGLPPGVLNVVTHAPGEAGPIGDELVENPSVRVINFTGSTATGRKLAEAAGRHLKRVVLELGGYNPLIVLADADVEYAVNAAAFGAFLHQGQICMSARKIIVERPIAAEFVAKLAAKTKGLKAGDPKEMDTIIGPLITKQALATVKGRVDDAVKKGAKVLAGGEVVGACYRATLISEVPDDSDLARYETFGPVATIEVVDSAEEAVARANATSYGLSSGLISQDADRALALAQGIDAGIVHINDQPVGDEPQMPFGGVKDSGYGRFGGRAVIDEFTEVRWITVQRGSHPFPF